MSRRGEQHIKQLVAEMEIYRPVGVSGEFFTDPAARSDANVFIVKTVRLLEAGAELEEGCQRVVDLGLDCIPSGAL